MHHVKTGTLSISRLEYGADVIIEPDHLDNFYLIQIPTQGYAESSLVHKSLFLILKLHLLFLLNNLYVCAGMRTHPSLF